MKKLNAIKLSKESQKRLVGKGYKTFSCECNGGWFDRSYMWWTQPSAYTPFLVRLLISAEGVLFPCERIGYTYSLGRVYSDNEVEINLNEISDYYNSMYKRIASKCSVCYNVYNCSTCLFQNNFSCKVVSRTDFEEKIKNVINGIIQFGHKFER